MKYTSKKIPLPSRQIKNTKYFYNYMFDPSYQVNKVNAYCVYVKYL